jgi:hypothetical protein
MPVPSDTVQPTVTLPAPPDGRVTVRVAVPAPSLTPYAALLNRRAPPSSFSWIWRAAVLCGPSWAGAVTPVSRSVRVSSPSSRLSPQSVTVNVLLLSPGLKVREPFGIGR